MKAKCRYTPLQFHIEENISNSGLVAPGVTISATSLRHFLLETPEGARFLLHYFGGSLAEKSQDEIAALASEIDRRAVADLPEHLQPVTLRNKETE